MQFGADMERFRAYLTDNRPRHIERIQRLVQQPSVSTEDLGVRECAQLLVDYHRQLGCQEANTVQTAGLPGLWAYYDAGGPKTIVVYGNFDTRPVLPSERWEHPAFGGHLASHGPYQTVLMGRGAFSYKGQYVAWLNALEALIAVEGTLPVNVMTLLEGDEILGSPYFRDMFATYHDRLSTAQASFSPGAAQDGAGRASMTLGYKGMIYADLVASGERWGRGPQAGPLHGMTKSIIDSPVWRLVHALSTLTKPNGNTFAVDGFYDALQSPSPEERKWALDYAMSVSDGGWNQALPGVAGAKVPAGDLPYEETVLNFFYGPSLNINGLRSGFTGPGTLPFSIPNKASARLDIRVPRGYKADAVVDQFKAHLESHGYPDVELDVMGAFDPSTTDPDSPLVRSIKRSFQIMDVPLLMAPSTGGGGPWSLYATEMGMPVIRNVGLGSGSAGSNEFLVIDGTDTVGGLVESELSHILMLKSYAEEEE